MRFQVVDTFADERFAGNPAAVVEVPGFPPDAVMQRTAHRIGLPTTAFVVPVAPARYRVRWFTPYKEINLCGHATIASARHLFLAPENTGQTRLTFVSDNGVLHAERDGALIAIDLPAAGLTVGEPPPGLLDALGTDAVVCAVSSDDVLVEVESAAAVAAVRPDFAALARQPFRGHIVTARGASGADFVSRTFFPSLGVDEDQVCVTAHCKLAPYWSPRLGRTRLKALQLSDRGGRLEVEDLGTRVRVLGTAIPREAGEVEAGDGVRKEALR
ncbi:PhzF family phenazine biosynthesis protein [Sphaerisporangium rubeum]|uniref:PhzF family phenazine biosynthesis protein n=1 Tax=Sphaerisporangium rubeum TaxID=321317 RepID=A0A7X0IAM4_9ACTN|nr:PhzF family phenazine biosynthesis protein [Sphaerisporangium rubeum]MBB6470949.1 PhzF family phenazine biosynthesis protein [Sphaerisporangium rubeum]